MLQNGTRMRTDQEQAALICRMIDNTHFDDIWEQLIKELGQRANEIGPIDLTRNPLRTTVIRQGKAYAPPPLVSGLDPDLAKLYGDYSASTLIERYQEADGHPLPSSLAQTLSRGLRYKLGAGWVGYAVGWGARGQAVTVKMIKPCEFEEITYASDDPAEPTRIVYSRERMIDGKWEDVRETYDLSDLDNPSYQVLKGEEDVTELVYGRTFTGEAYPWRYNDGRPFHAIVIDGHTDRLWDTASIVSGSLRVPALWTHWAAGVRDAGHPQRNISGAEPTGHDSDVDSRATGIDIGPERILSWRQINPDIPIGHWQDEPGFDPEVIGRAIRSYEKELGSALGIPVDYESTGGEPTEQEQRALDELIRATYPDERRTCGEILARGAALANMALDTSYSESDYGVLFREEVEQALNTEEVDDGGRDAGESDEDDPAGSGDPGQEEA